MRNHSSYYSSSLLKQQTARTELPPNTPELTLFFYDYNCYFFLFLLLFLSLIIFILLLLLLLTPGKTCFSCNIFWAFAALSALKYVRNAQPVNGREN